MPDFPLPVLPPAVDLESTAVLKQALKASRALAELKGISKTIPNQSILINILPLLEAKDSSEIENIITTHDEIYQQELFSHSIENAAAKEVSNYGKALRAGYFSVKETGLLTNNQLLEIHALIEENRAGFRTLPGTELRNQTSGETVYTQPQDYQTIIRLMTNLESIINEPGIWPIDPLIKMAVIHHQFESIHPFYDGNGRVGRILNILYLVKEGLLDMPVLYLSSYVIKNKDDYYRGLQGVRTHREWEKWVIYLLKGVEETALLTSKLVADIRDLMGQTKRRMRLQSGNLYSQDLLNNLFRHPYTKIDYLADELGKSRQTASKYLERLVQHGFLRKVTKGKHNYYVNEPLLELFVSED